MFHSETHAIVLGAGGLGCPALLGLSAAGVRSFTVVDDDHIDATNLQRQVLYRTADVGLAKAKAAGARLKARLPTLKLRSVEQRVDPESLTRLLDAHTAELGSRPWVVLECTDSPQTKFLVNDQCLARGIPAVIAGAITWRGQAMAIAPGKPCYRCIFEEPPPVALAQNCNASGVIGATTGQLGFLMAKLALDLIERGDRAAGQLYIVDMLSAEVRTLRPERRLGCPACDAIRQ